MAKYYTLYLRTKDNYSALVATSKDKWLLELFIVQRHLEKRDISVEKVSDKNLVGRSDKFLLYYFGHAITEFEYQYITSQTMEYESDLSYRIYEMGNILAMYGKVMKPSQKKALKNCIKKLKKIDIEKDKKFAAGMLDTIINRPGAVTDYMYAIDRFKECMEGEM